MIFVFNTFVTFGYLRKKILTIANIPTKARINIMTHSEERNTNSEKDNPTPNVDSPLASPAQNQEELRIMWLLCILQFNIVLIF